MKTLVWTTTAIACFCVLIVAAPCCSAEPTDRELDRRFAADVQPLLKTYCISCHGAEKQEARLNLAEVAGADSVAKQPRVWHLVRLRLSAQEMPPEDAASQPTADERRMLTAWIDESQRFEAERNAGDPGVVLARRLSNAELDYTIRDLTGVDIRPTREFPVDPANEAGFDNSSESLAMSPALLQKQLAAARTVADHLVLKPEGFVFAPHPAVTETDRDKYCVQRIIDFYNRHQVDYAEYFAAAWRYQHRAAIGQPSAELNDFAAEARISPKYLTTIWQLLTDRKVEAGPLAIVRSLWLELPTPIVNGKATAPEALKAACQQMRDIVVLLREGLPAEVPKLEADGISRGSQPLVLWRNRQSAAAHQKCAGRPHEDAARLKGLLEQRKDAAQLGMHFAIDANNEEAVSSMRTAFERFCRDFPEAFVVTDRGPYFDPKQAGKGRLLTAGFHLMQGYFRDDQPLCDLVLDERQREELDTLWQELNFITLVPQRQYKDFIFFERAEPPRFMREAEFDFARSEDKDATSPEKMRRLAELHLAKANRLGLSPGIVEAIQTYYARMETDVRWVEQTRLAAEPSHLADLATFAERAYRRPLKMEERDELLGFYQTLRDRDGLDHEDALRDSLASILLSPHFAYRVDLAPEGKGIQPLSDIALASRLSYFLWSSMPDRELLASAAAGDLHQPDVLLGQTQRMLRDAKVRGLATEFGGNWLDIRRFEEHNSVNRERFPTFTSELRQAMFEEPIRFIEDSLQHNRSVLEFIDGKHTFVNPSLARHYGLPEPEQNADGWTRVENAGRFGRGGLLGMAVFQTKNSPGLRTSPVKRGYWVVRRLLGEHIPAPPPTVPELPKDEALAGELSLPQLLARHREDRNCAGCHRRFDSIGLAFEGFGPIGERRETDLGGRAVQDRVVFPDGSEAAGLAGLRRYLREQRQDDFVDNFCRKLLAYALGRSLILSDEPLISTMKAKLAAADYAIGTTIETIVTSPQFLNQRGRDNSREP